MSFYEMQKPHPGMFLESMLGHALNVLGNMQNSIYSFGHCLKKHKPVVVVYRSYNGRSFINLES